MIRYIVFFIIFAYILHANTMCVNNTQANTLDMQKTQTNVSIAKKQQSLSKAINKYKEALEKKKEMIQTLWTTTAHIEFLMKENQIMRKEMIKHWRDVKETQASGRSL